MRGQITTVVGVLSMLALGAIPGAGSSATPADVTNLALAAGTFRLSGDQLVALVEEQGQGQRDLNDDGDSLDSVAFVHDGTADTTRNLRLAGVAQTVRGGLVAVSVSESAQGGTDLNGDGDVADVVLHLYSSETDSVTNLRVAVSIAVTDGVHVGFSVPEAAQGGTDLNGDGDANDEVAHLWSTAGVSNLRLAVFGGVLLESGHFVLRVSESAQAAADLNGDGDSLDSVLHVYDVASAQTTNVGRDARGCFPVAAGDLVAFCVSEAGQGARDLNGDGDAFDPILHVYDATAKTTRNVGMWTGVPMIDGSRVAFDVFESGQGADLNGDGDRQDPVAHVFDAATGTTLNLRVGVGFSPLIAGDLVALIVDFVFQVHDLESGITTNTRLASNTVPSVRADGVAFLVSEQAQGDVDLNGDRDSQDRVPHIYERSSQTVESLGIAALNADLDEKRLLFSVSEADQASTDFNGDGDTNDFVFHTHDRESGATVNLRLAESGVRSIDGGRVAFAVGETSQGQTDLNGDGDRFDNVLHLYSERLDNTPPSLAVVASPNRLFPPNHKYVTVRAVVTASDDSGEAPTLALVGVTSDEPDNAPGTSDGDTVQDIVIIDQTTFRLRAERDKNGDGRAYTITYRAVDGAGNTTNTSAVVTVPLASS
jgi:hypothetical protein